MKIVLVKDGLIKKRCKVGFSWTIFFFGIIPLALRGMWGGVVLGLLTFNLSSLYYMFAGNKRYINLLIEKGYKPEDEQDEAIVKRLCSN